MLKAYTKCPTEGEYRKTQEVRIRLNETSCKRYQDQLQGDKKFFVKLIRFCIMRKKIDLCRFCSSHVFCIFMKMS